MNAALHRKQSLHIEALHNRSERRGEKTYKYVKKTHERQYSFFSFFLGGGDQMV